MSAGFHSLPLVETSSPRWEADVLPGDAGTWELPRTCSYSGGTLAGEAAARAWLKDLRKRPYFDGGGLQDLALDLARSWAACRDDAEREAVRGQFVGFFATIEEIIQPLVRRLRTLESVTWEQLRSDVHTGLAMASDDDAEVRAEFQRRARCEAARRGWLTRRAKGGA